jgi:hypothetical protein
MRKIKLIETMRECRKQIWLYENNQFPYNETELQILKNIEENILVYLETVLPYRQRKTDFQNGSIISVKIKYFLNI